MATFSPFESKSTFSGATKQEAVTPDKNNTDIVAPVFKLYIEGVQVPFENITVTQQYGSKPFADIQIPAESGLLDIIRGYEPKVHIFYEDVNYGGDRLLFWGMIKSTSYARSRSAGSTYITFHCEHKNTLLSQMTMNFAGWASSANETLLDPNSQGGLKPNAFNSISMVVEALSGISGVAGENVNSISPSNPNVKDAPTNLLDGKLSKFQPRLCGMTGVSVNLWNQLKKTVYSEKTRSLATSKIYIPLYEEGISFFKRTSGHPSLEARLQNSKQTYCNHRINKETKINIPPSFRNPLMSAIQTETTVKAISSLVGFSGEMMSLDEMIQKIYYGSQYDILTLASPAEIPVDPAKFVDDVNKKGVEKSTIETIIKPMIPSYFAPICNVLLPRMYSSMQINQDEGSVPTRLSALHDAMPGSQGANNVAVSFKAPASYREAAAINHLLINPSADNKLDLGATKGTTFHIPGKYEQGVGIRHERMVMPWWLAVLYADKASQGNAGQEKMPIQGTQDYNDLIIASAEWKARNAKTTLENDETMTQKSSYKKEGLNPFDPNNQSVSAHERILYSTMDYEYSQRIANSRAGVIEAIFNPYIIPGYPMDVIDESPNHPSFHGFCTSVVHSITSRNVSTTISMINAVSYAELSNYYMPPLPPFLQSALNLVNGTIDETLYATKPPGSTEPVTSTAALLIQNPIAKAAADTFYKEVLGVGAAAPDELIHFASNRAYPLKREAGLLSPRIQPDNNASPSSSPGFNSRQNASSGRQTEDYFSSVGNLRLVRRPIESKESIIEKFGYNFIDIDPNLYNSTFVNYLNPKLASNFFLEPGASLFLDYMEVEDFIK